MEAKELRLKTREELTALERELRSKIRDMRFTLATRQSAKSRDYRNAKRDLARTLMVLNDLNITPRV